MELDRGFIENFRSHGENSQAFICFQYALLGFKNTSIISEIPWYSLLQNSGKGRIVTAHNESVTGMTFTNHILPTFKNAYLDIQFFFPKNSGKSNTFIHQTCDVDGKFPLYTPFSFANPRSSCTFKNIDESGSEWAKSLTVRSKRGTLPEYCSVTCQIVQMLKRIWELWIIKSMHASILSPIRHWKERYKLGISFREEEASSSCQQSIYSMQEMMITTNTSRKKRRGFSFGSESLWMPKWTLLVNSIPATLKSSPRSMSVPLGERERERERVFTLFIERNDTHTYTYSIYM